LSLNPPDDAELVALVKAWPTLPDVIRQSISAMVKAITGNNPKL